MLTFHLPLWKLITFPSSSSCHTEIKLSFSFGTCLIFCSFHIESLLTLMRISPMPTISNADPLANYTSSNIVFKNLTDCSGMERSSWVQDPRINRTNDKEMQGIIHFFCHHVCKVVPSLLPWFLAILLKVLVLPQFQHFGWLPNPDSLLHFLDLDLPQLEFLPYPLPFVSSFKAAPEHEASLESLLHTLSLRIKSWNPHTRAYSSLQNCW
jgi:hypothetical protein